LLKPIESKPRGLATEEACGRVRRGCGGPPERSVGVLRRKRTFAKWPRWGRREECRCI